jgi:putative holliday junction resolvase
MGGVIALDPGEKRTGFAVADALRITTEPLDVYHGGLDDEGLFKHLAGLLEERTVSTLVVGCPYNMDGTEGPQALKIKAWAERLGTRFPDQSVVLQDERLTTKEAEELLREAGHHGDARKARRDSWSALVILKDWITAGEPR